MNNIYNNKLGIQKYICNDNNISMYTYMIIYDYNLHIYIYIYIYTIVYSMRNSHCEYRGFCALKITVYNAIYIYTKFMKKIPDPRDNI